MKPFAFFCVIILLPIGLKAQPIALTSNYDAYNGTILIHVINTTDKIMHIRNDSYGTGSGSYIHFRLKDKLGQTISFYDAIFSETVNYQKLININPNSSKTFKYYLNNLRSSKSTKEVYSVDANCFIRYAIPDKNIPWQSFDKTLPIITKQDLMIYPGYDSHAKNMIITLSNASDHEISVRNPSSAVKFELLNQQGVKFATRSYPFIIKGTGAPSVIKIAPKSQVRLDYSFSQIAAGIADPSQVASVEAHFSAYYDIPAKNVTNALSARIYTFNAK